MTWAQVVLWVAVALLFSYGLLILLFVVLDYEVHRFPTREQRRRYRQVDRWRNSGGAR